MDIDPCSINETVSNSESQEQPKTGNFLEYFPRNFLILNLNPIEKLAKISNKYI